MKNEIIKIAKDLEQGTVTTEQAQTLLLGLFSVSGSLPFSEFEAFRKWIELESWYESSDGEYDKFEDPSCITLNINELYEEYKRSNDH